MLKKMKKTWADFCVTLDKSKYQEAFLMKGDLLSQGADPNELNLKVNTNELYIKQFQFPDVSKFDYSVEQLNGLEAAQKNLNDNIDNENLLDALIATAHTTANNLQAKYGDGWSPPQLEQPAKEATLD